MISIPLYCDTCGAANRPQASFCYACGQPLQAQIGKATIQVTGLLTLNSLLKLRYRILNQVGKGGFGAVYKASDLQFNNRLVAIKEMSQSNLNAQELAEATSAFQREAMLLAGLTHPNLPRIYEQFMELGRWYLVMDFIDGETLEDTLGKRPGNKLPVESALEIALQLCGVLSYLHTRQPPIIFRDLKPANIMLTPQSHIYLIDFGIARHFKPGQAKDTAALGSTGYAAPEQYGKAQTTQRADIYALGATLHQLLSGHDPSETPFQFAPLHLQGHPILARLEKLIFQMVEMNSNKRPASVAQVQQELQTITTQLLIGKTNPLPGGIPPTYQPPHSMPPLQPVQRPRRTAKPQPPRQSSTRAICAGHSSRITAVSWSPDATRLASSCFDKTVRLWDAASGACTLIYRGHANRVLAVAWSPDGRRIASAGNDSLVQVWDAQSGSLLFTYNNHQAAVTALAWSPDSSSIASASEDQSVHVWNAANGMLIYIHRGHRGAVQTVAWSPDGKRIASGGDDRTVQVWLPVKSSRSKAKSSFFSTLFSGALHVRDEFTYHGHHGKISSVAWSPNGQRIASVGADKTLQVWDAATEKKYFLHRNSSAALNTVAWSPDSRYLASGGNDMLGQVWDSITRHSIYTYRGHTSYIMSVAWSPKGKFLASTGVDRTVQVWEKP